MSGLELELDIQEGQELLQRNVQIENEKRSNERENTTFDINSRRNLISVAKETLKPKKIINKKNICNSSSPTKKYKTRIIQNQKKQIKRNKMSTDKQYLNYMLHEFKNISSIMINKQKKLNPSLNSINNYSNSNKNLSRNYYYKNLFTNNNIRLKKNCKEINLLTQICGEKEKIENFENVSESCNESQDRDKYSIFFTEAADSDRINMYEVKKNNPKNFLTEKKEESKNDPNFYTAKKNRVIKINNRKIDISFENFSDVYNRKNYFDKFNKL